MNKIAVGVFMGGMSLEKEVSFNSGRTVCDHLDTAKYHIVPIFQNSIGDLYQIPQKFLCRGKISDFEQRLALEAQRVEWHALKGLIQIAFIAQHGRFGEDGSLQGMLEMLRIPYVGSKVFGSALGMHKELQKIFLSSHGIKTARGIVVEPDEGHLLNHAHLKAHQLEFPLVVKPVHEGSSFGVSLAHTMDELHEAVHKAQIIFPDKQQSVIIEEKIRGMEFTCIVVQNERGIFEALSVTQIVAPDDDHIFDYEQKYMPGRATKWTPARCSSENMHRIEQTAARAAQALNFRTIGRIDGFLTPQGDIIIIDPNSLSGLAPSSFAFVQAAQKKISHKDLINTLLETEIRSVSMPTCLRDSGVTSGQAIDYEPDKITVAVLFGGESHEREISLESGRNVIYKLSPERYHIIPLYLSHALTFHVLTAEQLVLNSTHEIEATLHHGQQWSFEDLKRNSDFVFIALHGGLGENGALQGALEMLRIPYNGSGILASALSMDKQKTAALLKACGFNVPAHSFMALGALDDSDAISCPTNYPCVVKPHDDGCSVGVYRISNVQELHNALKTLKSAGHTHALIEELVPGMELTVGVLGNNTAVALLPSAAIATRGILSIEEKFLPGAGENQTPAPLPTAALTLVQRTVERVYKTIGCSGYARIDCFYQSAEVSPDGQERVVILEINSLPGLTPATVIFHQAAEADMSPSDFLDRVIKLGLEKHGAAETHMPAGSCVPILEAPYQA